MKLSFATLGCPGWSLEQIAANAKEFGFDGVELRGIAGEHIGPEESAGERTRIRALFASAGVEICCITGYSTFTRDDPEEREQNIRVAIQLIDLAQDVGCPRLRVFGGKLSPQVDWEGNLSRVVAGLKPVTEHAARAGVQIVLETHDGWLSGEKVMAVVNSVGSESLGVCWDIANSYFVEPIEKTFAAIRGHISHVHFKDAARVNQTEKSKLPGQGEVEMEKALRLLDGCGYKEYLSFEWEKKWEPTLEEPEEAFPYYMKFCTELLQKVGVKRG
jgi:sugar phosphate isomerase/epimerase